MWGRTFFPDEHTKRGRTIYEDEHTDWRGDVQVTKTNTHFSVYPHHFTKSHMEAGTLPKNLWIKNKL